MARSRIALWACVFLSGAAVPALAALGGDETSVETDRTQMKAELRSKTTVAAYTVHEIQTPSGTVVREYLSPEGKVFAVAWRGPTKPDLRSVLGPYFDAHVASANAERGGGGHHHLQINNPGLVMRSDGQMRALFGRAYVPQLVPAGVPVQAL